MAKSEEMQVLNWFLCKYPQWFSGVTAHSGTETEDRVCKIDAWLVKDGMKRFSIGIRRNADEHADTRFFHLRMQRADLDLDWFEFAKVKKGGGPQYYLQAWGPAPGALSDHILVDMNRLRETGCFEDGRFDAFWRVWTAPQDKTRWAGLPMESLLNMGQCVIIADVYDRGTLGHEYDALRGLPKRKHWRFAPPNLAK